MLVHYEHYERYYEQKGVAYTSVFTVHVFCLNLIQYTVNELFVPFFPYIELPVFIVYNYREKRERQKALGECFLCLHATSMNLFCRIKLCLYVKK